MNTPAVLAFQDCSVDDLIVEDEESFAHVALYSDLKQVLRDAGYRFRLLPASLEGRWEKALLLNLTFWGAADGADIMAGCVVPADVLAHVAWHRLTARELGGDAAQAPTAEGMFLGESIASAFDVYLVGRLLGHSPESSFLQTQVEAMAERAAAAGMTDAAFEELLDGIVEDPDRAFCDLRELLMDATTALYTSDTPDAALAALARFDGHRFGPLLHHYELSNWVLYARAYARPSEEARQKVAVIDRALRDAPVALDWLLKEWIGRV
jgi:hypothetical protein